MHTKNGLKEITWRSDLQLMLPSWANSCNGAKSAEAVIASFIGTETAFLSPSCIAFSLRSFSSYKSFKNYVELKVEINTYCIVASSNACY